MKQVLLIFALIISSSVSARGMQKCVDEKGNVSYQDKFCSDNRMQRDTVKNGKKIPSDTFKKYVTIIDGKVVDLLDHKEVKRRQLEYLMQQKESFLRGQDGAFGE
ncbi:MAG: DUF4124 domain-containing protein [Gammaproteobacteria bacterium]